MRANTNTTHPTNLGPRQQQEARKDADMLAARAVGVHKYLATGESFATNSDADAVAQLQAVIDEAQALIALIGRANRTVARRIK